MNELFGDMDIPEDELMKTYEAVRNNPVKMKSAPFEVDDEILRRMVFGKR